MKINLIAIFLLISLLNNGLYAQFETQEYAQLNGVEKIKAIAADWNLDGLNDIIYSSEDSIGNSLYLSLNEGNRQFSNSTLLIENSLASAHSFQVMDWDQNGQLDLLVTDIDSQSIRLMLQTTSMEFENVWIPIDQANGVLDIDLMDIDNDGDQDIVYANYQELTLSLILNTGNNTFTNPFILSQGYCGNNDLHFFDSDNDGDQDLLMANYCDTKVLFLENLGQGFFEEQNLTATTMNGNFNLETLDVDEDGKEDILVTVWDDAEVVWLKNMGNNTFTDPLPLFTQSTPNQLIAADLDNDGKKDLICSSWTGGVQWLKNMGTGSFEWKENLETGFDFVSSLDSKQIDEDGAIDLLIAERNGGSITVFYNEIEQIISSLESAVEQAIQYAPNPSSGLVHFTQLQQNKKAYSFHLYDLQGQLLQEHNLKEKNELQIYIQGTGLYVFSIQYEDGFKTGQLLIY